MLRARIAHDDRTYMAVLTSQTDLSPPLLTLEDWRGVLNKASKGASTCRRATPLAGKP